jgi:hypothetical protein
MNRALLLSLFLLASFVSVALPAFAIADMLEGFVISAENGKLTLRDQDGQRTHKLNVADGAKIKRDNREVKLADLMLGDRAKLITEQRPPNGTVVVAVDAWSIKH